MHTRAARPVEADLAARTERRGSALRARIFSEIGSGVLDVVGVLAALADLDYRGWIVVEQDTTWRAPSESAAMSMSVIRFAIRELAGGRARGAR